jgi:TyrR family helix-turn-helix protein
LSWRPTERPFKEQVLYAERQLIEQMMEENVSSRHIAKALGVSHTTVLNKIRSYQLESVISAARTDGAVYAGYSISFSNGDRHSRIPHSRISQVFSPRSLSSCVTL